MKKKSDSWYSPIRMEENNRVLSGAAAMTYRVKKENGIDTIIQKAYALGLQTALENVSRLYKKAF